MNKKLKGAVLASAVAGLFLAGHAALAKDSKTTEAKVHCSGINACAGKGACKSAENSCKGQNSCKGKGWIEVSSEKECIDKGGKVLAGM